MRQCVLLVFIFVYMVHFRSDLCYVTARNCTCMLCHGPDLLCHGPELYLYDINWLQSLCVSSCLHIAFALCVYAYESAKTCALTWIRTHDMTFRDSDDQDTNSPIAAPSIPAASPQEHVSMPVCTYMRVCVCVYIYIHMMEIYMHISLS